MERDLKTCDLHQVTNRDLLLLMFGPAWVDCYVTSFKNPPDGKPKPRWVGLRAGDTVMYMNQKTNNNYFTVSAFGQDSSGVYRRTTECFAGLFFFALDDIGGKYAAPDWPSPTVIMETSKGNYQWLYKLNEPITDPGQAKEFLQRMINKNADKRSDAIGDLSRNVRLLGWNNKLAYGPEPWHVQITHLDSEAVFTPAECCSWVGANWDEVKSQAQKLTSKTALADSQHHPLIAELAKRGMIKSSRPNHDGWWDLRCPWVDTHTDKMDDAAKLKINSDQTYGFKCFHSHCSQRTGNDLVLWLAQKIGSTMAENSDGQDLSTDPTPAINGPIADLDDVRDADLMSTDPAAPKPPTVVYSWQPRGDWTDDIYYLLAQDKWLIMSKGNILTTGSLNGGFARHVPAVLLNEKLSPVQRPQVHSAALYLNKILQKPPIFDIMYYPLSTDRLIEFNSNIYANTYKSCAYERTTNAKGHEHYALCETVLTYLYGKEQADLLINWMAWVCQNPGKKILWAVVLYGIEGSGKSLVGDLLRAALGPHNVKHISDTVIKTQFNGWMEGGCIGLIEEVRVKGESRMQTMNKLKTAITENVIMIEEKYRMPREVLNTQNYVICTNHEDALSLGEDSRRYAIFKNKLQTSAEVCKAIQDGIYQKVFSLAHRQPWLVWEWLMDRDVSRFAQEGLWRAPKTEATQEMIDLSLSPIDEAILDLKEDEHMVDDQFICITGLRQVLQTKYGINAAHPGRFARRLGYKHRRQVKVDGSIYKVCDKQETWDYKACCDFIARCVTKTGGKF